jgi:hypothetical protein
MVVSKIGAMVYPVRLMGRTCLLVLAAGMGSRFGGVKQVEPVGPDGETTLEYSIYDALRAGFDEVVFLLRSSIEADFRRVVISRLPPSVKWRIAFQEMDSLLEPPALAAAAGRTKPWGTAHALLCAAPELPHPFAIVNADDFYGRESFRIVHDFLASSRTASSDWCMGGFLLRNTTSPHGSVSRGLCSLDASGNLVSVKEHRTIRQSGGSFSSILPDGSILSLGGDEIVSMNLWGLTPAAFALTRPLFADFLSENAASPKAEYLLPDMIDALVSRKGARVRVLPTPEAWFGLTYREDRPAASLRVAALHASGLYPSPLWGRG